MRLIEKRAKKWGRVVEGTNRFRKKKAAGKSRDWKGFNPLHKRNTSLHHHHTKGEARLGGGLRTSLFWGVKEHASKINTIQTGVQK